MIPVFGAGHPGIGGLSESSIRVMYEELLLSVKLTQPRLCK